MSARAKGITGSLCLQRTGGGPIQRDVRARIAHALCVVNLASQHVPSQMGRKMPRSWYGIVFILNEPRKSFLVPPLIPNPPPGGSLHNTQKAYCFGLLLGFLQPNFNCPVSHGCYFFIHAY